MGHLSPFTFHFSLLTLHSRLLMSPRPLMRSLFNGFQQRASTRLRRYPGDLIAALVLAWFAWVASLSAHAQGSPTPTPLPVRQRPEPRVLQGGWYPWDPYQYRQNVHGVDVLTGFDVEIERAVARVMGVDLLLPEIAWDAGHQNQFFRRRQTVHRIVAISWTSWNRSNPNL